MLNSMPNYSLRAEAGTDLLASVLTCYPELGSVHYWCEKQALEFTFMLNPGMNLTLVQEALRPGLEFFHRLRKLNTRVWEICCRYEEAAAILTVVRDLETISQREIGLMVELLKLNFTDELIMDDFPLSGDELEFQEDLIHQLLTAVKLTEIPKNVIALRDEGRVLIFNN